MEILAQWNATSLLGKREYIHFLNHPPAELIDLLPPSLNNIDRVLSQRRALFTSEKRAELVGNLHHSHRRRHAPPSVYENLDRLANVNTFLIVTGQQPGLLGGPLLVFYKALHAITLAKQLNETREETFIPAFWNAAEDHDFAEIAQIGWLTKEKGTESFHWKREHGEHSPYFQISMDDLPLQELLQRVRATTFESEFREPLFEELIDLAEHSQSYPDFFDKVLWKIFPDDGLLILRPDDFFLRQAARSVIEREIQEPNHSAAAVERAGEKIQETGMQPQVYKRQDRVSFFLIRDGKRLAVNIVEDGFQDEEGKVYTKEELLNNLQNLPEQFSPSAILRPVVQDAVLPTAAAVLGPSELAYHFLLQEIYAFHQVTRPCLVPRIGFTFMETRDLKHLEKYRLSPLDLQEDLSALVKRVKREQEFVDLEAKCQNVEKKVQFFFSELCERAQAIDSSIVSVLEKNQYRIVQELQKSVQLLIRRQAVRAEQTRKQIEGLQNALLPHGVLQERFHSLLFYLIKYGPVVIEQFKETAQKIQPGDHVFVTME